MVIASRDAGDACIRSLDAGADDCVSSPIRVQEVLARIRAVFRRKAGHATSAIGCQALSLDLETRTLRFMGTITALSVREFALMHALLERPGALLSRSQLEDRIYGWGKEVESNALDVLIHKVRKTFGRSVIRNVRGCGWTAGGDEPSSRYQSTKQNSQPMRAQTHREDRPSVSV
jgi:two-component system OmpR family response regulator